jgi:glucans biosynthesis protein
MKRVFSVHALVGCLTLVCATGAVAAEPFDFDALRARAKAIAAKPYAPPQGTVPEWLRKLSYDDLRLIEFDGDQSLWYREKLPFQAQFLHPGFLFDKSVRLYELRSKQASPVPFRREYFKYRTVKSGDTPESMGYAGFRLMHPFEGAGTPFNEIGAFAGASYFRFLGKGNAYGLSDVHGILAGTTGTQIEKRDRLCAAR